MLEGLVLADDVGVVEDGLPIGNCRGRMQGRFRPWHCYCRDHQASRAGSGDWQLRVLGEQLRSRTLIIREASLALERGYHILTLAAWLWTGRSVVRDRSCSPSTRKLPISASGATRL